MNLIFAYADWTLFCGARYIRSYYRMGENGVFICVTGFN